MIVDSAMANNQQIQPSSLRQVAQELHQEYERLLKSNTTAKIDSEKIRQQLFTSLDYLRVIFTEWLFEDYCSWSLSGKLGCESEFIVSAETGDIILRSRRKLALYRQRGLEHLNLLSRQSALPPTQCVNSFRTEYDKHKDKIRLDPSESVNYFRGAFMALHEDVYAEDYLLFKAILALALDQDNVLSPDLRILVSIVARSLFDDYVSTGTLLGRSATSAPLSQLDIWDFCGREKNRIFSLARCVCQRILQLKSPEDLAKDVAVDNTLSLLPVLCIYIPLDSIPPLGEIAEQIVIAIDRLVISDEIAETQKNIVHMMVIALKLMDMASRNFTAHHLALCVRWLKKDLAPLTASYGNSSSQRTSIHIDDELRDFYKLKTLFLQLCSIDGSSQESIDAAWSCGMDQVLVQIAEGNVEHSLATTALSSFRSLLRYGFEEDSPERIAKIKEIGAERLVNIGISLLITEDKKYSSTATSFLCGLMHHEEVLGAFSREQMMLTGEIQTPIEVLLRHVDEETRRIHFTLVWAEVRSCGTGTWEEIWAKSKVVSTFYKFLQGAYVLKSADDPFSTEGLLYVLVYSSLFEKILPPKVVSRTPLLHEVCRYAFNNHDSMAVTMLTMLIAREPKEIPDTSGGMQEAKRDGMVDDEDIKEFLQEEAQTERAYVVECIRRQGFLGQLWNYLSSTPKEDRYKLLADDTERIRFLNYLHLVYLLLTAGGMSEIVTENALWSSGVSLLLELAEDTNSTVSAAHKVQILEWLLKMFKHVCTTEGLLASMSKQHLVACNVLERAHVLEALLSLNRDEVVSRKKRKATRRGAQVIDHLIEQLAIVLAE